MTIDQGYQLDWWEKQIGDVFITELSTPLLAEELEELQVKIGKHGKVLSPSTVNRYRAAFSSVLKKASEE